MVEVGRQMLGATDPLKSNPGTIRGDFGIDVGRLSSLSILMCILVHVISYMQTMYSKPALLSEYLFDQLLNNLTE